MAKNKISTEISSPLTSQNWKKIKIATNLKEYEPGICSFLGFFFLKKFQIKILHPTIATFHLEGEIKELNLSP